jgi:hypothetical protein
LIVPVIDFASFVIVRQDVINREALHTGLQPRLKEMLIGLSFLNEKCRRADLRQHFVLALGDIESVLCSFFCIGALILRHSKNKATKFTLGSSLNLSFNLILIGIPS